MKRMKKLASVALALVMAVAMMVPAFAAENNKSITVQNAAKGETYTLYKIFDAKVVKDRPSNDASGITYSYEGNLPDSLATVFEKDAENGTIKVVDGVSETAIMNAVKAWAETAPKAGTQIAQGGVVTFTGLADGYYAVLSSVSNGTAVTITSIAPNATVYDKNDAGTPTFPDGEGKTADGITFDKGSTVTYTVKFNTVNWVGKGDAAEQVTEYTIKDEATSNYLNNVNVTSITIDGVDYKVDNTVPQFVNGAITFPWTNAAGDSLYANGAQIVITYTATVIGDGAGKNTVSASYKTDGNPIDVPEQPNVTIYNSTIVVDKYTEIGGVNTKLAGAKFVLKNSDGKFYKIADNAVSWVNNQEDATEVTTGADGAASFAGLKDGTYQLIETEAPNGYNLKTDPTDVTVKAADTEHAVTYTSPVLNQSGAVLPSTGGMGTTIFYVVGGILLAGSAVLFITKKRMGSAD